MNDKVNLHKKLGTTTFQHNITKAAKKKMKKIGSNYWQIKLVPVVTTIGKFVTLRHSNRKLEVFAAVEDYNKLISTLINT